MEGQKAKASSSRSKGEKSSMAADKDKSKTHKLSLKGNAPVFLLVMLC
jgi:hypothetical protein